MDASVLSALQRAWQRCFRSRALAPVSGVTSRLGDLLAIPEAWQCDEGFQQPEWKRIAALIDARTTTEPEREAAWHHASLQWLNRLATELGNGFRVGESRHFLLVSAKSDTAFRFVLNQGELALGHLRARLGVAAWHWKHGKHAVLMFEGENDYYRYISHFHLDGGEYGGSSGMCLRGSGYCHTALAPAKNALPALVHELTHLCLTGQSLPLWLEEGLATHLEREITGRGGSKIDRESIAYQRVYWNRENIQRFWTGVSFRVGEERRLSYGLAEHLVALLSREFRDLGSFVCAARREDAGQAAAREHLDLDLREIAAAFLGEGDWQPRPGATKPV